MIDVDEFLQVMKSLSISDFTEEDAKKVMQIIDLDSDGKITVEGEILMLTFRSF